MEGEACGGKGLQSWNLSLSWRDLGLLEIQESGKEAECWCESAHSHLGQAWGLFQTLVQLLD